MRKIVLLLIGIFVAASLYSALAGNGSAADVADFDHFYPTYDELVDFLNDLSFNSPIAAAYTIGSSDEAVPRDLIAIKISDNPDIEEDEPGFLFVGVIHGDEPLGVRVVLHLIETLTEGYATDPEVQHWVDAYEIWIVPVINPYGYDNIWRKNGPNTIDPNTSGVDLNRNFDFRWDQADVVPIDSDTYRGPYAGSEPETQAFRNFVIDQRPAFGITFHSGRGGTAGEIMYPWNPVPPSVYPNPPDRERIIDIANVIADAVMVSRGGGQLDSPSIEDAGAIGQSNCNNHAVTGMFDYMLETNSGDDWVDAFFYNVDLDSYTAAQQTRLDEAREYVLSYLDGIRGLMRHFLFSSVGGFRFTGPGVTGLVYDGLTGDPLAATVQVLEIDDTDGDGDVDQDDLDLDGDGDFDMLFRTADELFGRHLRLLEFGTWTFEFKVVGYRTQTIPVNLLFGPGSVPLFHLDVALDPGIDTDGDGLTDYEELHIYNTDPEDEDSDDDGLNDGDEVNIHGTDPLNPDTDGDELPDGDEVSIGTDPLASDTDGDGLMDGREVSIGTDPLDPDTDDDGLLDGEDVEFIQNVVNSLPPHAFKSGKSDKGHRTAINSILRNVETHLLIGETEEAITLLNNLRKHVDGEPHADRNDWILNNAARLQVRDLIDVLLSNLS